MAVFSKFTKREITLTTVVQISWNLDWTVSGVVWRKSSTRFLIFWFFAIFWAIKNAESAKIAKNCVFSDFTGQAPKYGVTDTDRLPHRLPALKSRRTIFRFNVKLQNRLSRSVRLPKNRFRLPENRFRVASQTDYFKIGYLNRFGYLKKSVRLPKNRFGYLKIGSVT